MSEVLTQFPFVHRHLYSLVLQGPFGGRYAVLPSLERFVVQRLPKLLLAQPFFSFVTVR